MFEKHAVKREIKIPKCERARCSLRMVMKLSHNKPLVLEICRVFFVRTANELKCVISEMPIDLD